MSINVLLKKKKKKKKDKSTYIIHRKIKSILFQLTHFSDVLFTHLMTNISQHTATRKTCTSTKQVSKQALKHRRRKSRIARI